MILGLINARGGSKGIPGKNIKLLGGKPLIAYSIELGLKVSQIDRLVVSTDSEEIASISRSYGADVPWLRPAWLATDKALQIETIKHAISNVEQIYGDKVSYVVLLQPTAPFRSGKDIRICLEKTISSSAETGITVCKMASVHPSGLYSVDHEGWAKSLGDTSLQGFNRQDLPDFYWRTGAVYVLKRSTVMDENRLYGDKIMTVECPPERSFNLDTLFDWELAEAWLLRRVGDYE